MANSRATGDGDQGDLVAAATAAAPVVLMKLASSSAADNLAAGTLWVNIVGGWASD